MRRHADAGHAEADAGCRRPTGSDAGCRRPTGSDTCAGLLPCCVRVAGASAPMRMRGAVGDHPVQTQVPEACTVAESAMVVEL